MPVTRNDYSNVQNEGQDYAQQWHTWVQGQPWFTQRLQQLQQELAHAPATTGRPGFLIQGNALAHFREDIGEQSKKLGHLPPQDFRLDANGGLNYDDFMDRNPWMYAVLMGGIAAGPIIGAAAHAGTAAGTAGGVGIGETGATTGLTGAQAAALLGTSGTAGGIGGGIGAGTAAGVGTAAAGSTAGTIGSAVGHAATSGIDWTSLLATLGGSVASGLSGAFGQQQRQSFSGTKADPVSALANAQGAIGEFSKPLHERATTPPELTGPQGATLPTFTGGGMPTPIGVRRNTSSTQGGPPSPDEIQQLRSSLSLLAGGRR